MLFRTIFSFIFPCRIINGISAENGNLDLDNENSRTLDAIDDVDSPISNAKQTDNRLSFSQ